MSPITATKDVNILRNSEDPVALVNTARLFAASDDPADQAVVSQYLGSKDFLDRLDPPDAYAYFRPHQLGAAGILKTLMDVDGPPQRQTLVGLTGRGAFNQYDALIELLIKALAYDKPASQPTITYWEQYLDPESVYADHVVNAIFLNQTRPALDLFERTMADPEQDTEYRLSWLRDGLLPKRNDTPVLECCERMVIGGTIAPDWRESVIEAVFDFQSGWYGSCRKPTPPLRVAAPDVSKDCLERLGRHAVYQMALFNPELELKVRMALREIGRELDDGEKSNA